MLRSLAARWPRLRPLLPAAVVAATWPACPAGEGPLVAFLGDSLTSGWQLGETEAYPALVGRALAARGRPIRVWNAGVSGETAPQGLARLPAVLKRRPDVLVVAFGANDGLGSGSLDETEEALRRIVLGARAEGARVLLVGIRLGVGADRPRVGATAGDATRAARLVDLHARLAAALRVAFVPDLLAGVTGEASLLFPDRLHPNAAGHERLAANVVPALEVVLAEAAATGR